MAQIILNLVDGGQRAVIFDRFTGVKPDVVGEGTHFLIPWVQRPIIFDIRSTPRAIATVTGSKGKGPTSIVKNADKVGRGDKKFKLRYFRPAKCINYSTYLA